MLKPSRILLVRSGAFSSQSVIEICLVDEEYLIRHQLAKLFKLDVYLEFDPSKEFKEAKVSLDELKKLFQILEQIKIPLYPVSNEGVVDGGYNRLRIENGENISELKWFPPYTYNDWELEEFVALVRNTVSQLLYDGESLDIHE